MFFASGGSPKWACAGADAVINAVNPAAAHAAPRSGESSRFAASSSSCLFLDFGPRPACSARRAGPTRPAETVVAIQRRLDPFGRERRVAQAHAGQLHHRTRDRGRNEGRGHLARAGRMVVGRDHLDMHDRHLVHARHAVVVEVRLLDHAVLDVDALDQGHAQPIDDAALGLRHHVIRLHRDAAVDGAPELMHLDLSAAAVDRHLGDAGDLRAE